FRQRHAAGLYQEIYRLAACTNTQQGAVWQTTSTFYTV
ncbi:MAG: hypothetical protein ACI8R0_003410, partial [Alteromonadales bacterium]